MRIDFDIQGAAEMERLLLELGPAVASRVGDQALVAAAKPIMEEMRRTVAIGKGQGPHLRDAIKVAVVKQADGPERIALIGFDRKVAFRAHFLEYGTAHSSAKPFMRPALDSKVQEALDEMGKALARGITREAKKLAKK